MQSCIKMVKTGSCTIDISVCSYQLKKCSCHCPYHCWERGSQSVVIVVYVEGCRVSSAELYWYASGMSQTVEWILNL